MKDDVINYIYNDVKDLKKEVRFMRVDLNNYKVKMSYLAGGISTLTTLAILLIKHVI